MSSTTLATSLDDSSTSGYSLSGSYQLAIAVCVLSVISVCLRFWSRKIVPTISIGADDWVALGAVVCNIGITALGLSSYVDNLGSHMKFVSAPDITELMQKLWAMGLLLVFSISFSKISVLIYY
ncbi:hypothetical protein MMC10_010821, partial [Thelotrema lepadinum]|nr:hypothetical protein [Thelotrema lepadinum]